MKDTNKLNTYAVTIEHKARTTLSIKAADKYEAERKIKAWDVYDPDDLTDRVVVSNEVVSVEHKPDAPMIPEDIGSFTNMYTIEGQGRRAAVLIGNGLLDEFITTCVDASANKLMAVERFDQYEDARDLAELFVRTGETKEYDDD